MPENRVEGFFSSIFSSIMELWSKISSFCGFELHTKQSLEGVASIAFSVSKKISSPSGSSAVIQVFSGITTFSVAPEPRTKQNTVFAGWAGLGEKFSLLKNEKRCFQGA